MYVLCLCSVKKDLVVTEVSAIQATLGEICSDEVIERFAEVWEDIGLEEGHRKDRRETIRKHLIEMLTEMLSEELVLKQKLHESVHTCTAEVQKLAGELGNKATIVSGSHSSYYFNSKPIPHILHYVSTATQSCVCVCDRCEFSVHLLQPGPEVSLLLREKDLRSQVDAMNKEKHDRMKRLKRLTEMESSISASLGRQPQLLSVYQSQVTPKEEDLLVYRRQVEDMEKIKVGGRCGITQGRERGKLQPSFCVTREGSAMPGRGGVGVAV